MLLLLPKNKRREERSRARMAEGGGEEGALPLWEAEEVSWLGSVALTFPSVASAGVLGAAVRGVGVVALGSSGVAGGTGVDADVPGMEEALGARTVELGGIWGAVVVVGGSNGGVEAGAREVALRPRALVVLPSSGAAVGDGLGLLEEVGAVVGRSGRGQKQKGAP